MANLNRCALCQPISLDVIMATGITLPLEPHWLAWKDLSDSQNPCGLCALVYHSLRFQLQSNMDVLLFRYNGSYKMVVVAATTKHLLLEDIKIKLLCGERGEAWIPSRRSARAAAFLSVMRGPGEAKSGNIVRRMTSSNPGSDECLSLAKRWLTDCSACLETDTNFVPTRLIDVHLAKLVSLQTGDAPGSLGDCLRHDSNLRSNSPSSNPIKYAALSYCWGPDPFLTTTSSNIQTMQQSIPFSQLPRTILDVINIVRYLGVRYLWVDSLCILQGTDKAAQEDWVAESRKMGQIYQSAYVTISAESASNAHVGILNDREAPADDVCTLPASPGSPDVVYLAKHRFVVPEVHEPLRRRGWTLQETILSRRLLKFGTREISWSCPHTEETESLCETREHTKQPCSTLGNARSDQPYNTTRALSEKSRMIYENWENIMEDYSRRDLTKKVDKLHAIKGLVELAHWSANCFYAAGVWTAGTRGQSNLRGLLWVHQQRKPEFSRKEEFEAPSWSWASVVGPVRFLRYDQAPNVVVNICAWGGLSDPRFDFQEMLSITGCVLRIGTIRCQQFGTYHGGYDRFLPWMTLSATLKTYLDDLDEIPKKYKRGGEGSPMELVNSYFLLLARDPGPPELGVGLILLPARKSSSYFRRIGMFEGFPMDEFGPLGQPYKSKARHLMWNIGGQRTIKIV
ncbi:HET-domain-containing protein [Lentithecium fluviatile CBS 122367]|uniref:HET-domain-containing protein n=1 Tax=Lentithecium fluviatile CBS 122367 TaxID=1168545 RepID=A0A6G1IT10_9PLEO|nr:HET-domain-containing protein [Lentithecium fluviatile CBS 122367]